MGSNLTYGELTAIGRQQLIKNIEQDINNESIFMDIGCGYGKLVTDVAEYFNIKSIGVEIDREKVNIANKINWLPYNVRKKITFYNQDITQNIKLLQHANIAFCNNVCFDTPLQNFIFENFKGILIFSRKPKNKELIKTKPEVFKLKVSWNEQNLHTFYKTNTIDNR